MFYIPRYLWKVLEGGKVKMLAAELNTPIVDEDMKKSRIGMMVKYFNINMNTHNPYAIKYIVCEALNFVNVIGQIYFTDRYAYTTPQPTRHVYTYLPSSNLSSLPGDVHHSMFRVLSSFHCTFSFPSFVQQLLCTTFHHYNLIMFFRVFLVHLNGRCFRIC